MGILAIDFGLKRIGIAGSDDLGIASHPVKLLFNDSKEEYFDDILSIIGEREPDLILIGLPIKDDGRLKIQTDIVNFAKILKDNDIKFIGPSPEIIKMMGDKIQAKNTAKKYGIPVIEGSEGGISNFCLLYTSDAADE